MKAVVLAAGLGTRLGELTETRQKGTLSIGAYPLVAHVLAHLHRCGFEEIAVNLHYYPAQLRAALAEARARITWFEEPELLGTAGALAQMGDFLDGETAFLVHYGDVLTDHDLGEMVERHRERAAIFTLLVHQRPGSNSIVEVDDDMRVRALLERPSPIERAGSSSPWVNSGVYVASDLVLDDLPTPPSDVARDLVPRLLPSGGVYAEPLAGYRCAVDSAERLAEARSAFASGRWNSPLRHGGAGP